MAGGGGGGHKAWWHSKYRLLAQYPDTFPYFRVDVVAPGLFLPLQ